MLGIVGLIFIVILSVKLFVAMNKHHTAMVDNQITPVKIRILQLSPILYIPSVIAFVLPISWLVWLAPIPFGFLLLAPGITLGRKYSKLLECSGTDVGVEASKTASNIMWLGVGVVIFIIGNILISLLIPNTDIIQ